jgi:hypothetical protein
MDDDQRLAPCWKSSYASSDFLIRPRRRKRALMGLLVVGGIGRAHGVPRARVWCDFRSQFSISRDGERVVPNGGRAVVCAHYLLAILKRAMAINEMAVLVARIEAAGHARNRLFVVFALEAHLLGPSVGRDIVSWPIYF